MTHEQRERLSSTIINAVFKAGGIDEVTIILEHFTKGDGDVETYVFAVYADHDNAIERLKSLRQENTPRSTFTQHRCVIEEIS